ncbi:hypothetical protein A5686_18615 [Mycobacterium sp. E2479]|nr:hypothetical protein A5686_18615 [Mycobacterium sp. E2479]
MEAAVAARTDVAVPRLRQAAARPGNAIARLEAVLDESGRLMREYPDLAAFEWVIRVENAIAVDATRTGEFHAFREIIDGIVADAFREGGLAGHEHRGGRRSKRPGLKALRDIITEVVDDAQAQGALPAGTDAGAAVNALHALARGLTERAASLGPDAYAATLDSAKGLLRGTLFTDGPQ